MSRRELPERAQEGYAHPLFNRIMHWSHAFLIVFLAWTGFQIAHRGVNFTGFGIAWSILLHKIAGVILLIQMPIWLIYRIASTRFVWRDLPRGSDFWRDGLRQLRYYAFDIFAGRPHPFDPRELNPLQRISYFIMMIIALPLVILTGVVLYWPETFEWVLSWFSLVGITRLHLILSYAFVFFMLLHIYLSTTGKKPWSHFKAMFTGWVSRDEIDEYERRVEEEKAKANTNP